MKKPIIFYVDDEPNNLTIFEASVPDTWQVYTFDSPITALKELERYHPSIVLSDQRMPIMKGVEFLELVKKLLPSAIRIVVTGYSDEDLVIESVRKAQVFDYLRKPWETEELIASLQRALDFYSLNQEREELLNTLQKQQAELKDKTENLSKAKLELELSIAKEKQMRQELESWVPPFVVWAIQSENVKFPLMRNLIGVTFDIIESSRLHGQLVNGKPVRKRILELFSEAIMRHSGWRESHAGDSAYAHFGLVESQKPPAEAALAAAQDFRVALRGLSKVSGLDFECGIALHLSKDTIVDVHTIQISTDAGIKTQKSFDTSSRDVDLLHRIEKLTHALPGTNIILTADFLSQLHSIPQRLIDLGYVAVRGQTECVRLHLIPSDLASGEALQKFKNEYFEETKELAQQKYDKETLGKNSQNNQKSKSDEAA
ncbi:MAG: response regulator [Oligoflexales bacterium]|nr:response regulator [Oligoflexales bacterium]